MLTIRDLELKRIFVGGDWRRTKFVTTAEVRIGSGYANKATVTLTDEQTAKAIDFILGMIRDGLTVEMEAPEVIEDEPEKPDVVAAEEVEML